MSLRTDLKDAIDEVTPPAPALESRVKELVVADGRNRRVSVGLRRHYPWNYGFRGIAAMVAAALVLVLIVGVVAGGRFLRDWANGESSQAYSVNQSELRSLESRPFVLPELQPGAACPYTDVSDGLPVRGNGPVYLINASTVGRTNRGDWFEPTFYYQGQRPGIVLVRARDLVTDQRFVFAQSSRQSGAIATGPALGTDQLNGYKIQLHPEAALPDPWQQQPVTQELKVMFAVPRATLCWGFQFDGPGFSETYVNGWDTPADKGS